VPDAVGVCGDGDDDGVGIDEEGNGGVGLGGAGKTDGGGIRLGLESFYSGDPEIFGDWH